MAKAPHSFSLIRVIRRRRVAAELNPAPFIWFPRRKPRHPKFVPWLLPRPKHRKARVAAWLNPQPQLWRQKPRRPKHLPKLSRPRKHAKVAAWLVVAQAAPVFIPRKRKRRPARQFFRPRRHAHIAGIIGARVFLLPPSQAWNWNAQAGKLNFTLGTPSRPWNWHGQPAVLGLSLGTVSKAWVWSANTATLNFILRMGQAWSWVGRATMTGGNLPCHVKHAYDVTRGVIWGVIRGTIDRNPLS